MKQTYCRKNDAEIQRKIDRGIWRPSLDTGHIYSTEKHANLTETINNAGYSVIGKKDTQVSRVIWIAAHGIPQAGMEIDHINGDKQDNRLQNLQIVTPSENRIKANGLLTFTQAEAIRKAHKEGTTQAALAKQYHVAPNTISYIIARKTYKKQPPHERNQEQAKLEISKLDSETRAEICAEHARGASYRQIAARWHLTITAVKAIIRGEP